MAVRHWAVAIACALIVAWMVARRLTRPPPHVLRINRRARGIGTTAAADGRLWELMRRHDELLARPDELYAYWDYRDPKKTEWIQFMSALTEADGPYLVPLVRPLVQGGAVLDVGGNTGAFARLLEGVDVTVWDQAHVVARSDYRPSVGGNFLSDPVPGAFRTALFKSVLHDLSDEDAERILRKVARAGVARVVVAEVMRPLDPRRRRAPYFRHLRPFEALFRSASAYEAMARRVGLEKREERRLASLMYTVLVFEPPSSAAVR